MKLNEVKTLDIYTVPQEDQIDWNINGYFLAIKILKQEIDWHQKHTGIGRIGGKTDDWVDGFIKGCEHCLVVLTKTIHSK